MIRNRKWFRLSIGVIGKNVYCTITKLRRELYNSFVVLTCNIDEYLNNSNILFFYCKNIFVLKGTEMINSSLLMVSSLK